MAGMRDCTQCGGRLKRIHRTFWERFSYMAIFECRDCHDVSCIPRQYRYHFGAHARCPQCGTFRVTRLKQRDRIDPMYTGLLNMLERMAGGGLFHCRYCRIQFFDRRKTAPEGVSKEGPADVGIAKSAE